MSCLAEAGELHGTQQMSKQPLAFCGGDRYLWDLLHFHTKVPPFKRFVCGETAAASAASRPAAERSRAASSAHLCERAIKCQSLKNQREPHQRLHINQLFGSHGATERAQNTHAQKEEPVSIIR